MLLFDGYGFNVSNSPYSCIFERGLQTMITDAQPLNSTSLQCLTPAWGSIYPADGGSVLVEVYEGSDLLDYTGGNFMDTPCQPGGRCQFDFYEDWNG
eukprot:3551129-Rhodomonas_salina.1